MAASSADVGGTPLPANKPLLRGWLHLVCFVPSLVAGIGLIMTVHGTLHTTAAAIYAGAVSGLFGASALYHRWNWSETVKQLLQRIDHAWIFLLIAGTATPVLLIEVPRPGGLVMLCVIWGLTATTMAIHLAWMAAPEVLVGGTYIALGCLAAVGLPYVWRSAGIAAFVLILAGGLLYIVGAVSYHRRWPDPNPRVFGFHEVFHAFVSTAALVQYIAIAVFIL